jgi:hypothetical protein
MKTMTVYHALAPGRPRDVMMAFASFSERFGSDACEIALVELPAYVQMTTCNTRRVLAALTADGCLVLGYQSGYRTIVTIQLNATLIAEKHRLAMRRLKHSLRWKDANEGCPAKIARPEFDSPTSTFTRRELSEVTQPELLSAPERRSSTQSESFLPKVIRGEPYERRRAIQLLDELRDDQEILRAALKLLRLIEWESESVSPLRSPRTTAPEARSGDFGQNGSLSFSELKEQTEIIRRLTKTWPDQHDRTRKMIARLYKPDVEWRWTHSDSDEINSLADKLADSVENELDLEGDIFSNKSIRICKIHLASFAQCLSDFPDLVREIRAGKTS